MVLGQLPMEKIIQSTNFLSQLVNSVSKRHQRDFDDTADDCTQESMRKKKKTEHVQSLDAYKLFNSFNNFDQMAGLVTYSTRINQMLYNTSLNMLGQLPIYANHKVLNLADQIHTHNIFVFKVSFFIHIKI